MQAAIPGMAIARPTYEVGARLWIITITVILCSMLELIDTSIVNVALTQMAGNLGATINEISWVVAAYAIANVIVVPMSSWFSNTFGRRNYFAGSVIVFTVASIFCGNSHNLWELVAFRFIQGAGGGGLLATAQSILADSWPPEKRATSQALFGMGVVIGPTIGPTLGGWIVDNYDWPWIFYVNVPLGIIATFLTLNYIRNTKSQQNSKQIDFIGIIFLIIGIGALQLVLEKGESEDWFAKPYIVWSTVIAIAGILAFIFWELNVKNPVVDLRVLKVRTLALGVILSAALGFGIYGSVFVIPIFMQSIEGFTATQTGLLLLPGAICTGMMMPMVGRLIQGGLSQKYLIGAAFIIYFFFTFWMYQVLAPSSSEADFFYPLLLRGLGLGMLFVPINTYAMSGLKPKDIPQGIGLLNMMRQLAGSFSVAILSTYVERRVQQHRSDLLYHISAYDTPVQETLRSATRGLMASGASSLNAARQAYGVIEGRIYKSAAVMSYRDTFILIGIFFLCCVPLVFFMRRVKGAKVSIADAAH